MAEYKGPVNTRRKIAGHRHCLKVVIFKYLKNIRNSIWPGFCLGLVNDLEDLSMAISFNQALGLFPTALKLRDQRNEVLASNLANADTPNFKAKDMDFQAILRGANKQNLKMTVSDVQHLDPSPPAGSAELQYRIPRQPSLDGNTVESEQEQVRYAENALGYQFSLRLLGEKFDGLKSAIRGE
jgi:flagellar basal-body rod protein FlgB